MRYISQLDRQIKGGTGMVFSGRNGSGKTHLAAIIAVNALQHGYRVRFTTFGDALSKLYEFVGAKNPERANPFQVLSECDLLVLDDLGSEYLTDFASAQLFGLLNERLNRSRPTIFTTNVAPEKLGECLSNDPLQAKRLSERITKISACFTVEALKSYREQVLSRRLDELFADDDTQEVIEDIGTENATQGEMA
jgi:DNA replication protein DnaC